MLEPSILLIVLLRLVALARHIIITQVFVEEATLRASAVRVVTVVVALRDVVRVAIRVVVVVVVRVIPVCNLFLGIAKDDLAGDSVDLGSRNSVAVELG